MKSADIELLQEMNLLYVEDNDDTREIAIDFFGEYFNDIVVAHNGLDGLQKFDKHDIDMVITDINMPDMNGLEMIRQIRERDDTAIVIALSAYSNKSYLVDSIKLGIDDYIFKPLDMSSFEEALTNVLEKYRVKIERRKSMEKLEDEIRKQTEIMEEKDRELARKSQMAHYDQLTGLCNRYCFHERYDEVHSGPEWSRRRMGLVLIDIDDFKNINDTWGHDVGDVVLRSFAKIIIDNTRDHDSAARWGGEEFAIMLSESSIEGVSAIAERIRREVESFEFYRVGKVTASFGTTICEIDESLESAMKRCDEALYNAKYNGKNRVYIG
jgi:diguanylate cyclase (GGDEF)-like protein